MIIAGEASGDLHGAKLAHALNNRSPDTSLFGVGGIAMKSEGVEILVDCKDSLRDGDNRGVCQTADDLPRPWQS